MAPVGAKRINLRIATLLSALIIFKRMEFFLVSVGDGIKLKLNTGC